jgi:hypothetical protein
MKDIYIIRHEPDGEGAPYFFDLSWTPDLPTFHYPSENPVQGALSTCYRAMADIPQLTADWLPDHFLASKDFLAVCDAFECKYVSRPVELFTQGIAKQDKSYFFFAVVERLRAMDLNSSSFVLDSNVKLGAFDLKDSSYERIDKLVVLENIDSDLFYFEEIHEVACSARFLNECVNKKIHGLTFKKIDDDYRYAPWDDF